MATARAKKKFGALPKNERRQQILSVAREAFAKRGYHQTTIDDIVAQAGVARGTFYLYFESKRAIFDELLDGFFATLSKAVRRIDTSPGASPPLDQMHDTVERIFAVLGQERSMARILIREAVGLDEEFDRKLRDFYGRVTDLIARALREGVAMGLVRPCDPDVVSWCVLGSVKQVIDRVFVDGAGDQDATRLGRELIGFILNGVFR